jgi:hypothetical protein
MVCVFHASYLPRICHVGACCDTIYDYGCLFRVKICVMDACYKPGYVLRVNDIKETICCGCMLLAK